VIGFTLRPLHTEETIPPCPLDSGYMGPSVSVDMVADNHDHGKIGMDMEGYVTVQIFVEESKGNLEWSVQRLATGWTTKGRSSSPGGRKNFHVSISSRPALGPTQPPIQWVTGFFPGVKRPGREDDHSPPTSAEVKKTWVYTSTPTSWRSA
jgi:hypothetical protein